MSEEATKYWDTRQWYAAADGTKDKRLITLRKVVLNDAAKRQRENADLEYAKHLLDAPLSDLIRKHHEQMLYGNVNERTSEYER